MTVLTDHLPLLAGSPNGIKKLRALILELAVRGKLVPQDAAEGESAHFLKQSREERASAMCVGLIKNEKPAAAVQVADQPFALPKGWAWCRVVDTGSYINGLAFSARDWNSVGRPIIRIQNLSGRNAQFNRTSTEVDDAVIVNKGDILVSWSATLDAYIWRGEQGVLNQHIFRVEPSSIVVRAYLYWLLKWVIRVLADSDHSHGLVMAHINRGPFLAQPVGLPPLAEQHRIVAKIDELMALCDRLEAQQANAEGAHAQLVQALLDSLAQASDADDFAASWQRLYEHFDTLFTTEASIDALKQTVLQLAVIGKLVPQDPADEPAKELLKRIDVEKQRLLLEGSLKTNKQLPAISPPELVHEIPSSWAWARLLQCCEIVTDGEHLTPQRTSDPTQVPLVTAKNVRDSYIDLAKTDFVDRSVAEKCWKRCKPRCGDILLVSVGATLGRLSVLRSNIDMVIVRSVTLSRPLFIDSDYLALAIQSPPLQKAIWSGVKQSAQPGLYLAQSTSLVVAIPPAAEQGRIVAKVDELMSLCDQLKSRIRQARALNEQLAGSLVERAVA